MESKKTIRIAMKITESIIEILKEEFGDDEKGRTGTVETNIKIRNVDLENTISS